MSHKQLRSAQLIAPFGPGSLYTDRQGTPHVVCGLDYWFHRDESPGGMTQTEKLTEFDRFDPRLLALLKVDRLLSPAPFRRVFRGQTAPQNHLLYTPAHRFPTWYRNSKTGKLRRFRLSQRRLEPAGDGARWAPVRFVAVCSAGHLCEFPWKSWARCVCEGDGELILVDRGGSDLGSVSVRCKKCNAPGRTMTGVMQRPAGLDQTPLQRAGISCSGDRPWLGEHASQSCGEALVGALINQTNLYFAKTVSSILIPDMAPHSDAYQQIRECLTSNSALLGRANLLFQMDEEDAIAICHRAVERVGITATADEVAVVLKSILRPSSVLVAGASAPSVPDGELQAYRRSEFNVLRERVDDLKAIADLRVIPAEVPASLGRYLSRVNLIERLKETRAFIGFDRLEPSPQPLAGMPERALSQLFAKPPTQEGQRWLPAVEVFGEGLYIELSEEMIANWQKGNGQWLDERLDDQFILRVAGQHQTLAPTPASLVWASRYLLVHTLAHALLNQMVFESGYSTAALRERLYVSADTAAPMAGILIYTASGDSEGTLGGLVRLGQQDRLEGLFSRALSRASWCSVDPLCSEKLGGQGSRMANLAACHACVLLPETACETINHGLDRAMLVGTPEHREHGAFCELLDSMVALA